MAVQCEIFDERELDSVTLKPEPDAEALALIEELGLKAQVAADGTRLAYPKPTAEQAFVLSVLFSQKTELNRYDAGAIPLRVLKEIRSYLAEHPAHRLYVLHAPPAQVKDPFLIACDNQYSFQDGPDACRLVARWGDGLEPWSDLLTKARKSFSVSYDNALAGIISKAQMIRTQIANGGIPKSGNGTLPELHLPTPPVTLSNGASEDMPF